MASGTDRSDRWDGGYKRKGVFIIYKRIRGKLYEISTRCRSSGAAEKQFIRFQADPENFKPQGETPKGALMLDVALTEPFLHWSRDEKHNTPKWVRDQKRALVWWEARLTGANLRALKTARLVAALDSLACDPETGKSQGRKQMIATIKTFYGWLIRVRHEIDANADPTLGLTVPQARPKQWTHLKAISREDYDAALAKLQGWPRDALTVLGGTGWHVTELERFAESGTVESHPHTREPVLVCPQTKGGEQLRTQVGQDVAEAAKRIRERGKMNYFRFRDALRDSGATFNPGYLRHSVATWAINAGASPQAVSAFLGHKSMATTKKFYATHAVPAKIPTLADGSKNRADDASNPPKTI